MCIRDSPSLLFPTGHLVRVNPHPHWRPPGRRRPLETTSPLKLIRQVATRHWLPGPHSNWVLKPAANPGKRPSQLPRKGNHLQAVSATSASSQRNGL
eukprot:7702159-Alexandrium_andersonii.AAC.1